MSSSLAVTTSMWRTFLAPKGPRTAWSLWGNSPFLVKYLLPHTFTPVLTTTGLKSQKIVQKQDQSRLTARGWFTKYLSPDAGLPNALGRNAFGCILVTRVEMGLVGYLSRLQHFWPVIWVNQGLWQAEWTIGAVRLTPQNVEVPQAVRMARWRPARRPRKPQMGHRVAQSDHLASRWHHVAQTDAWQPLALDPSHHSALSNVFTRNRLWPSTCIYRNKPSPV